MPSKAQLLKQLKTRDSSLINELGGIYSNENIIEKKLTQLIEILDNPSLENETETVLARCPGRISLSKHADYINSDLLYLLDDRDVYLAGQITDSNSQIKLINSNHNFSDLHISTNELNQHLENKSSWYFYPLKIIQELEIDLTNKSLILNYDSDLPTGSGLSSSHALMISTYLVLQQLFKLPKKTNQELIYFCQRIETERGFKSGLGDQSAQLFSKKGQFSFIKLFPELTTQYKELPEELGIITAPSFIKADKSLPEFSEANENIKKYKSINELASKLGAEYLADLVYIKTEKEIYQFLEEIENPRLQALALYGLAEAARVKDLKENGITLERLGAHLKLSHQAEQRFVFKDGTWQSYRYNYKLNQTIALKDQTGYYGASTLENDQIQTLAISLEGVYGASISGAGLGGNDIIICDRNKASTIKDQLIERFYSTRGLEQKALERVHITSFSNEASLILG